MTRDSSIIDLGQVLFAPTKASEASFRPTLKELLSYFIGGINSEDAGFALTSWKAIRFEVVRTILAMGFAVSMVHYYFTDANAGDETNVEFTFTYIDSDVRLRIILHHSSVPYSP